MKIIHITASYKPAYIYGGPIMSVAKLCEAIAEQVANKEQGIKNKEGKETKTNEIQVFTTTANGKKELNVPRREPQMVDGVRVTYFKRITKDHTHFSASLLLHLRKVLRQAQHDNTKIIVHIHAWWNLVSIFSCFIAKWFKAPVVLSPRGMLTHYTQQNRHSLAKKIIHQTIGKNLLSYCHIHVTSELERVDIQSIIIPKSITVIPNLVELSQGGHPPSSDVRASFYRNAETTDEKRKTNEEKQVFKLIFLSRIEQKKGLDFLFEGLNALEFNWQLTIAGSGEEDYVESLKAKVKNLKLNSKIIWVGQIKNEDKFSLLAHHDLMILTSYNENFANVVIESLSVGTPVLISNKVGLADYVEQKDFGWIAPLNIDEIKNEILKAHQDVKKRNFIRENAPKTIVIDFSDDLVNRYIKLYQTLI
ncbi:glycosyltransferase involved in cell wall biosynthesis [Pedobacter sp. UYP30]|uniref:XrtY-associated glycosyltransferase XYAG1 n=1 Tax=Pedobacter sp. UYP30 TaxID=1756400 RepID=UPI0033931F70